MYRRAVVPLDGSMVAETIIPFILEVAGPMDLEVVLLRVIPPIATRKLQDASPEVVEDLETLRADAEEYLAALAAELRSRGVRFKTEVRHGDPGAEIVGAAQAADADLIAMTTHGRSGLRRVLFGSVAEAVLRQARIPVFLLRQTEADVARRVAQRRHGA
jgi:nucleotide-binding universal stress UspA family protein